MPTRPTNHRASTTDSASTRSTGTMRPRKRWQRKTTAEPVRPWPFSTFRYSSTSRRWSTARPISWAIGTRASAARGSTRTCLPPCSSGGTSRGRSSGDDHVSDFESTLHGIRPSYGRTTGFSAYGRESSLRRDRVILIEATRPPSPLGCVPKGARRCNTKPLWARKLLQAHRRNREKGPIPPAPGKNLIYTSQPCIIRNRPCIRATSPRSSETVSSFTWLLSLVRTSSAR